MEFSILKEDIVKYLRAVSGAVDKRGSQGMPILSNVLLRVDDSSITLMTTDDGIELAAKTKKIKVKSVGDTTVSFRKLNDLCRALPASSEILFKLHNNKLFIKSGNSKFSLVVLSSSGFPHINVKKTILDFRVSKKELRKIISKTAFAMADQDVRYFLNGMLFEIKDKKLFVVAADGHRLSMNFTLINNISEKSSIRVIVPRKSVLEILRIFDDADENVGELSFSIGTKHLSVLSGDLCFRSKLLEGKFPDYEKVIPKNLDKSVVFDREILKEALIRASSLFGEREKGVRFSFSKDQVKIFASNDENEEVEDVLALDYSGLNSEISFNIRYLLDYLSSVNASKILFKFLNSSNSVLISIYNEEEKEVEEGFYILMPMRI